MSGMFFSVRRGDEAEWIAGAFEAEIVRGFFARLVFSLLQRKEGNGGVTIEAEIWLR